MALSRITEAVASFTDLTIGDDLTLTDDFLMASDASIIKFGADADVTLTHVHNTGLLLNSTSVIQFNDSSQNIGAPNATTLDINATDEIELNATLIDINGNVEISGTATTTGVHTFTATPVFSSDITLSDDLNLTSDSAIITFGANSEIALTHVHDTGLLLTDSGGSPTLQLHDSAESVSSDGSKLILTSNSVAFSLPTSDGSNGQALVTNGSGVLSFAAAGSNTPSSADGQALGSASLEWSDLFLADGGQILFGNDQEITLTHDADVGLKLKHTATADDKPIVLTLQTGETDMAANDVMGAIRFQAPDEGTGTDAILVAAAIQAVSEGDFSSSSNATRLEFHTGASEAASSKMTLSSAGLLTIADDLIIKDGGTIGVASDADAITIASNGQLTLTQTLIGTALDISGDIDVDGTTNLDNTDIDGTLNVQGETTLQTHLNLGDDDKIKLGASGDLEIYHDGSDSFITDAGTGRLKIQGSRVDINKNDGSEGMAAFIEDAQVILYYDNAVKLETTTTGVNITGAVNIGGTGTANALDDYEEGTFTPILQNSGGVQPSAYDLQTGFYTKIGRLVHASGTVSPNGLGSASGNVLLGGLPFDSLSTSNNNSSLQIGHAVNLNSSAGRSVSGFLPANTTNAQVHIYDAADGTSPLQFSELSADGQLTYSIQYQTP